MTFIQPLVREMTTIIKSLVGNSAILYELKESESILLIFRVISTACPIENIFIKTCCLEILETVIDSSDSLFIDYLHRNKIVSMLVNVLKVIDKGEYTTVAVIIETL